MNRFKGTKTFVLIFLFDFFSKNCSVYSLLNNKSSVSATTDVNYVRVNNNATDELP